MSSQSIQRKIAALTAQMLKAAAAEDFKRAVEKRPDLKPKVDELLKSTNP